MTIKICAIYLFLDYEDSISFDTENFDKRHLRRSDVLDLSITLEPGELSRICDVSGVMNEKSIINVESSKRYLIK